MTRPRTPTRILELRGARRSRLKARENEPEPEGGIGSAPGHLTAAERKAWDELAAIVPAGVMGQSDRIAFERMARLMVMARTNSDEWTSAREKDLISYLSRFGLTPADRSRVSIPKPKSGGGWDEL